MDFNSDSVSPKILFVGQSQYSGKTGLDVEPPPRRKSRYRRRRRRWKLCWKIRPNSMGSASRCPCVCWSGWKTYNLGESLRLRSNLFWKLIARHSPLKDIRCAALPTRRAGDDAIPNRTHWSLTHPPRLPPVGVTAKIKMGFSSLFKKWGRERGKKEAKTILIFGGSLWAVQNLFFVVHFSPDNLAT